jgi:hypothetical protein
MNLNDSSKQERNSMGIIAARWVIIWALAAFGSTALWAGQSLVWQSSSLSITAADVPDDQDLRLEFQMHGFQSEGTTRTVAWLSFFDFQITSYINQGFWIQHGKGALV